jgi:hypothetical protein
MSDQDTEAPREPNPDEEPDESPVPDPEQQQDRPSAENDPEAD